MPLRHVVMIEKDEPPVPNRLIDPIRPRWRWFCTTPRCRRHGPWTDIEQNADDGGIAHEDLYNKSRR